MKGNPKLLDTLNEILTGELTAINQYLIHSRMCDNWGYERLAEMARKEAIDEMKHADKLIERILHLEGVPNMQRLEKVKVGERVVEQLKLDLELESSAVARLNKALALAVETGDNRSREMLEEILEAEDKHVTLLESQLTLVKQVGEQNYLAQQIRKS